MIQDILDAIFDWFVEMLRDTSSTLMEALIAAGMLVLPPWVTQSASVINDRFRVVVVACYALVICIGALMVMGSDNIQFTYSAREIIPRLVAGFFLALMSWEIVTSLANINNSLVISLLLGSSDAEIPSDASSVSGALDMVLLSYDLTQMVFVELFVEVLRIVAIIMLFICMFTRNIAWFMVCLLSPVALAAHGLPFTEGAAFLWWRMTFACLASSLGQAWILWVWDSLFAGLSDTEVLLNYPLKPFYALVLVWLIWRVHKAAFLWARGRPVRVPGARLLKAVTTAVVVGAVMRSNPVAAVASRVPGVAKVANRLTRGAFSRAAAKASRPKTGQQAASQPSDHRSDKPWRMRSNTDGPGGATKLHTHGPGQSSCPHCKTVAKPNPSRTKEKPSGSPQQGPKQGRGKRGNGTGKGKTPPPQAQSGTRQSPSSKRQPKSGTTPRQTPNSRQSNAAPQNPAGPKPPRRELPPDRRPKWVTPPVRRDGKQRPNWQAPPTRRPGYRKGENQ